MRTLLDVFVLIPAGLITLAVAGSRLWSRRPPPMMIEQPDGQGSPLPRPWPVDPAVRAAFTASMLVAGRQAVLDARLTALEQTRGVRARV